MLVTTKKDKGLKHILKQAEKLGRKESYVTVGVHKDATYPDGLKVAQNAFWQHEGTRTIPARPFIRKALNTEKQQFRAKETELLKQILIGKDTYIFLNGLGFSVQVAIQRGIATAPTWAIPLSETTKANKTGRVLFESGTLYRSIGYQITNNGKQEAVRRSK